MNTFFLYILYIYTIYYLQYIYLLLTTYYNILLCFNKLGVGSNMIFQCYFLTTLLFFLLKSTCAAYFFTHFYLNFPQKSKKICQFFAIFSLCVSMIYEKFEKIIAQKT